MARRHSDAGQLPWPRKPKNLETFVPGEFPDVRAWHSARASVARSLGRSALAEIRGMSRLQRGRNNNNNNNNNGKAL